jgi:hypothetical protein
VNYTGKLEDGTIFDSTTDEAWLKANKRKGAALMFKVLCVCLVASIQGWAWRGPGGRSAVGGVGGGHKLVGEKLSFEGLG